MHQSLQGATFHIEHVIPRVRGGTSELENLALACPSCNLHKADQIPEHWDVRRNGRLFAQRNETGFGELPILEVSLRTGVRVRDMDNLKRKQVMSDAEKYKRAAKGDIAYNTMRMWQGALGTAPVDGLVSLAYIVARPFEETNPYYYSYLFRTEGYKAEVDGYSRDTIRDEWRADTLVVYLLSKNFFDSPVCLSEMGATWVQTKEHIPILIPPFGFADVKGVIGGSRKLI